MNTTKRQLSYVVIAWTLIICYSILQISAVESLIRFSPINPPNEKVKQIIVFVYGLAVVSFMGGSQIPAVFMKKKSYTVQFAFNAIFGFILLLVTFLNDPAFSQFHNPMFYSFFEKYPPIALEYLSIPYFFMIYLDLYQHKHLGDFSWSDCREYLTNLILHPHRAIESIFYRHSVLYSLFSIVFTSVVWVLREIILTFQPSFTLSRWMIFSSNIGNAFDPVFRASLMIPIGLSLWLLGSCLTYVLAEGLGGEGSFLEVLSLLGIALLPSSMIVVVDIIELGVAGFGLPAAIFLILDFIFLVVWPFILITVAIGISKNLSVPRASLSAVAAVLLIVFLVVEGFL